MASATPSRPPSQKGTGIGLRGLLVGLIGLVSLTALTLATATHVFLGAQEQDARVINVAGRQRMFSQKMSKEVLAIQAGLDAEANSKALANTAALFERSHRALRQGDQELRIPPTTEPAIAAQLQTVDGIWKEFGQAVQQILTATDQGEAFQAAADKILATNGSLLAEMNKAVGLYEAAAQAKITRLKLLLLVGGCLVLAVTAGCWFFITVKILAPIRRLMAMIADLGRGNLGSRLRLDRSDELGILARSLDSFADSLQFEILTAFDKLADGDFTFKTDGLISVPLARANNALNETMTQLQLFGEQIAAGSEQVSGTSQTLSQAATQTASSLEQITASMNQIAGQTRQNAENAAQANEISSQARDAAESGNSHMQNMVRAMREVNEAGQNISKIIKVIDEIAFQTNLLALNAAVEAARAGKHGKGFAVVAEEVRNLAARSAKAAKETAELIESSVAKARNGMETADQSASALAEIAVSIGKASDLVAEIAAASHEQAQGISQVSIGLEQIDLATQQNTASAESAAAISEELFAQAAGLRKMLTHFNLGPQQAKPPTTGRPLIGGEGISLPAPQPKEGGSRLIEWTPSLSVNIMLIDRQHQKLVNYINELHSAMRTGKAREVQEKILDNLVQYTASHFAEEERLMAKHNYPEIQRHKEAHAALVANVLDFQKKLQEGSTMISSDLFNFLKSWLINHIQKVDKQYGPFLNDHGVL